MDTREAREEIDRRIDDPGGEVFPNIESVLDVHVLIVKFLEGIVDNEKILVGLTLLDKLITRYVSEYSTQALPLDAFIRYCCLTIHKLTKEEA